MKIFTMIFAVTLMGCGTLKESTVETTEPVKIPSVVIHDTVTVAVPYMVEVQNGIDIDSAKRDYFIKNCKGTMEVDKDGLKATISFLSRDNKGKAETIIQLTSEIKKKEQEILQTKKVVSTRETPGWFWIWTHSFLYQFITFCAGATLIILLQIKKKIIP